VNVRKLVIPAAGLGTRLLPTTKEMPKEMLPIFTSFRGKVVTKPLLQAIFEDLHSKGIREFCFVARARAQVRVCEARHRKEDRVEGYAEELLA
jgi:UTP-glucose-1-phosphate uridylyltransferase